MQLVHTLSSISPNICLNPLPEDARMISLTRVLANFGKKAILLPLSYMLLIFILSSIPEDNEQLIGKILAQIEPEIQNLLHIPLFGFLFVLWFAAFANFNIKTNHNLLLTAAISITYGIFDECHQYFVPGRVLSLFDLLLNVTGVALGWFYAKRSFTAI